MPLPVIKNTKVKSILSKSNLPVCEYAANQYAGCTHGCTRELLMQLKDSGAKLSIATKSDLILRDLDLIKMFPDARVSWFINTLDEEFKKDMDRASSYQEIYSKENREYWEILDAGLRAFADGIGLDYVTNDGSMIRPFDAPPVVVNYFYHEKSKNRTGFMEMVEDVGVGDVLRIAFGSDFFSFFLIREKLLCEKFYYCPQRSLMPQNPCLFVRGY